MTASLLDDLPPSAVRMIRMKSGSVRLKYVVQLPFESPPFAWPNVAADNYLERSATTIVSAKIVDAGHQ
jgi:hypothetical protein